MLSRHEDLIDDRHGAWFHLLIFFAPGDFDKYICSGETKPLCNKNVGELVIKNILLSKETRRSGIFFPFSG
jgi:hypothetical protein